MIFIPPDSNSYVIERVIDGSAINFQRSINFARLSLNIKTPCQTDFNHASQLIIICPRRVSIYANYTIKNKIQKPTTDGSNYLLVIGMWKSDRHSLRDLIMAVH